MWTECVQATSNHKDLPEWQQRYMDFMFEVNDTSGNAAYYPSNVLSSKFDTSVVFTGRGGLNRMSLSR